MLEWYRPGAGMDALIDETTACLRAVLPPVVACRGVNTELSRRRAPHRGRGVRALCRRRRAGHGRGCAGARGGRRRSRCATARAGRICSSGLLLERIEPQLGSRHPTFLTHWPAAQAALARRDPADPRVAERFELFVCGIELANAFVELTDAAEQRARFEDDRARRHATDRTGLAAGRGLPRGAGPRHAAMRRHRAGLRPARNDRIRRPIASIRCYG